MANFIPISFKIKDATKKLKEYGYVVITDDDERFAILAERKKIICTNVTDFLKKAAELSQ